MTKIVVQAEMAEQIRMSDGPIVLVDDRGMQVGVVRRPPTAQEIAEAQGRVGKPGPKFTVDELIARVEAL